MDSPHTSTSTTVRANSVQALAAGLAAHLSPASSLRGRLIRGGLGSLVLRLSSTALVFLLTILLARSLGPEGYGVYAFVFALVSLFAIPAQLGLPQLIVRETAQAQAAEQWGQMRGLWRWSTLAMCLLSSIVVALAFVGLWLFSDRLDDITLETLVAGVALVPLIALGNLCGGALRGLGHVLMGQFPEDIFRVCLFFGLCLVVLVALPSQTLTAASAMALHTLAALTALGFGVWLLRRARPSKLISQPTPVYAARTWTVSAWPLALTDGLGLLIWQLGILLLGLFSTAQTVGLYKVAVAVVTLVTFGFTVVKLIVMSYIARLYGEGDRVRLQRLVTHSARAILALAVPVTLALVLFGKPFLALALGPDYVSAYSALVVLAVGQLVYAVMGLAGVLLNMTGHERDTLRCVAIAALANVVLSLALIPRYQLVGAAVATALTLIIWSLLLRRTAWQRIQIETSAFSFRRRL